MSSRSRWRWPAGILVSAAVAAVAAVLTTAAIGRTLDDEVARQFRALRELVVPIVDRIPDESAFADLELVLAMPDVRGIEVFGEQGRRIWHAGESLEIVGYRMSERSTLTHAAAQEPRYEVFWSAQALQARHGVALRVDVRWRNALLRRIATWTIATSAVLLGVGIALGMIAFARKGEPRNE